MLDRNQLKSVGIRYARSLQMLFKTASMFSSSHSSLTTPLQHSFDQLNSIVKQTRQFTLGFVDQRVMINNILTTERSLVSLENEFLKRGIGAITFEAGITMAAYKHAVLLLAVPPKHIEEQGGLASYLAQNPFEFVRVFHASKNQQRTDSGDTILDMDSESFLMAKALSDMRAPGLDKIDWFLQSSGIQGGGPGGTGTGQTGTNEGGASIGGPSGEGAGLGGAGLGGTAAGGSGSGGGTGEGDGHGSGSGGAASPGSPAGITSMVESYFNSSVVEADGEQRSYHELARIISETRPEFVLSSFPPSRREELRKLPPDQMAAEVIEDTAVKWAVDRLVSAPTGNEALIVEEEVIRVLLRSLQATQSASRLARKLADHIKEFKIPQTTQLRIQEELEWVVVPGKEKTTRLLAIERFSTAQFRRLLQHCSDLMKAGDSPHVTELANHYMAVLDSQAGPQPEDLGRVPELVQTLAGLRTEFWTKSTERLTTALERFEDQQFLHQQVLNSLIAIAHVLAKFEDFDVIDGIGTAIDHRIAADPVKHQPCCEIALAKLLTAHAVDRIIEIYLYKRDDRNIVKTTAALLRRSGSVAVGKVFRALEDEQNTANRLALLRLISRIGAPALQLARESLKDDRWYVVRNACKLLSDLKDPDILTQIAPSLRHADERVQKAAATAIMETRDPARASVFAEALSELHPQVLEDVLAELLFLRDPVCLPSLEKLIFGESKGTRLLLTCVQTVAAVPGPQAEDVLLKILLNSAIEAPVRRLALAALNRSESPRVQDVMSKFASSGQDDPIAIEVQKTLSKSQ